MFHLLGSTLIYEEHKGDYAKARAAAARGVEEAQRDSCPSLGERLLELALVQTLQGDCGEALVSCDRARRESGRDPERLLCLTAIELWATTVRWNRYPDGTAADAEEAWSRWKRQEFVDRNASQWDDAFERVAPGPRRLRSEIIYRVLATLPIGRRMAQDERARTDNDWARRASQGPFWFIENPTLLEGEPRSSAAMALIAGELGFHSQRYEYAVKMTSSAADSYERAGDHAGMAACDLAQGDYRTGSRFSPLTWHTRMTDGDSGTVSLADVMTEFEPPGPNHVQVARERYGRAAERFAAAGEPRGTAAVLLRLGYLAATEGNFAKAVEHYAAACDQYASCGDWLAWDIARTHLLLAQIGADPLIQDLDTAAVIGKQGRSARSFSHALGLGLLIRRIGQRWQATGDVERAMAAHRTALALFEGLGAPLNVAQSWTDLGSARGSIGDRHAAACDFDNAIAVYRRDEEDRKELHGVIVSKMLNTMTYTYLAYERAADPRGIDWAADQLAELRSSPSPFQHSPELTAWQLETAIENGRVTARCYHALEKLREGDERAAAKFFDEALAHAAAARAQSPHFLEGVVRAHQRRFEDARRCFERYREDPERNADVAAAASQGDERLTRLRERQALEEHAMGSLRLHAYDDAMRQFEALAERFGPSWWLGSTSPWQSLAAIAETCEYRGDFVTALQLYETALADVERRRMATRRVIHRLTFGDEIAVSHIYFAAARAAVKALETHASEMPDEGRAALTAFAFRNLQANQARTLSDFWEDDGLKRIANDPRVWELTVRLQTWRSLIADARHHGDRSEVDRYARHFRETDDELRRLEAAMAADRTEAATDTTPSADAGLASLPGPYDICDALPPGSVLVQYMFREELLIAVLTSDRHVRVSRHSGIGAREIDALVRSVRAGRERVDVDGGTLADLLLAPIAQELDAYQNIIIVADGSTNLLPFAMLPWREQPLCATHVVTTLPSAALAVTLARTGASPHTGVTIVGNPASMTFAPTVGDVVLDPSPLPAFGTEPLMGARLEAEVVAAGMPGAALRCGPDATREEVLPLAQQSRLIHLATHACLVDIAPTLSCILLANGDRLNTEHLARNQNLRADLIVLSACDTSGGPVSRGNDALSLPRALLAAGARTVLVTLWEVQDDSAAFLLWRFYENCAMGLPIAAALAQAQTWLKTLCAEEALGVLSRWAALPLSGDARAALDRFEARMARTARKKSDHLPFAAPVHWAPFVCLGLPDVSLPVRPSP